MAHFPILVIVRILDHLTFVDFLLLRFLSQDFNFCAIERLKNRLNFVTLATQKRLIQFLTLFSNSIHPIPFQRFVLNPKTIGGNELNIFLESYAENIVKLCISPFSPEDNLLVDSWEQVHVEYQTQRTPLHQLSFILEHTKCLEVLQINMDLTLHREIEYPPAPVLPQLTIFEFHHYHTV